MDNLLIAAATLIDMIFWGLATFISPFLLLVLVVCLESARCDREDTHYPTE